MPSRRRARQRALQILFLWDVRRPPVDDAINQYYGTLYLEEEPERDPFVHDLVEGTVSHIGKVDEHITRHAERWRASFLTKSRCSL
jgi:transcription antitermination protein NusB